jgi:hypothetical protein
MRMSARNYVSFVDAAGPAKSGHLVTPDAGASARWRQTLLKTSESPAARTTGLSSCEFLVLRAPAPIAQPSAASKAIGFPGL